MKRLVVLVLTLITIFSCSNVYAKDTVYSLNKYNEEIYKTINKSYSSEGKVDGYIVAGTYQKKDNEESENKNSKAIVVKYDSYGKVLWTYAYGKDKNVDFNALTYLYDEESNVIGYEIILHDNNENKSYLIKINLSGKLLEEKELTIDNNVISKVKEIRASDNKFDSFIAIATNNEKTYLIKYDKEFNKKSKRKQSISKKNESHEKHQKRHLHARDNLRAAMVGTARRRPQQNVRSSGRRGQSEHPVRRTCRHGQTRCQILSPHPKRRSVPAARKERYPRQHPARHAQHVLARRQPGRHRLRLRRPRLLHQLMGSRRRQHHRQIGRRNRLRRNTDHHEKLARQAENGFRLGLLLRRYHLPQTGKGQYPTRQRQSRRHDLLLHTRRPNRTHRQRWI